MNWLVSILPHRFWASFLGGGLTRRSISEAGISHFFPIFVPRSSPFLSHLRTDDCGTPSSSENSETVYIFLTFLGSGIMSALRQIARYEK